MQKLLPLYIPPPCIGRALSIIWESRVLGGSGCWQNDGTQKNKKNKNWHPRSPRRIRQWRRSIPNSRASTNTDPGQPTSGEGAGGSDLKISQTDETDCETHSALALAASASHGGSSVRKQFVAAIQKVSVNEPPLCTRPPTASVLGTHPHTRDSKRRRQPLSFFSLLHLVRVGGR